MPLDSVLVTGCTSGSIGSALALAFHSTNSIHVFATARSLNHLQHLTHLPNLTPIVLDVTSPLSITAAVELVKKTKDGRLKYLVNNAGVGMVMPLLDVDIEKAKSVYDVNIWGMLAVTQAFAPLLVDAGKEREGGVVVNIGSSAGIYHTSKSAANLLSEILRLELEPLNIRVLTIVAGIIKTNFFSGISSSFSLPSTSYYSSMLEVLKRIAGGETPGNAMTPEEFAANVLRAVLNGKRGNRYWGMGTLGWSVPVVGWFPGWALWHSVTTRGHVISHVGAEGSRGRATPEVTTEDGFESQFQTNHLSHFLLFCLFKPTLLASATPEFGSRIINLSSLGHRRGEPNLNNINLTGCYDKWRAYGSSKTCNIWMANEIERRHGSKNLHAFSVHPGGVVTPLWNSMDPEDVTHLRSQSGFDESLKSPEQGAATTVWGAVAKCLEGDGGKYLDDVQIAGPWTADQPFALPGWAPHAYDAARESELWRLSLDWAGLKDADA
ncbi:hypothetical protein G7Y89_g6788 [Cudoniella acicularis]|uniref:Uncharacterized protein n=1 Tax=Cudoniella acicularis TaxID=354080 RepID=A0A8H4RLL4_9HELO|nr:hypothetical protein G7Y89_g6788 [Cudoniella acicularis]